MAPFACPVCVDQDGDFFDYVVEGNGIFPSGGTRFYYAYFAKLRVSAGWGCRFCRILQEGIDKFWGDNPARMLEKIGAVFEDGEGSEDEEGGRNMIRIEINRGQSLAITHIAVSKANGSFEKEMRNAIEFYTKPGRDPPNS